MKTIQQEIENEIIIKKSRFITVLYKINSVEDVNQRLSDSKIRWKDATHYCYAYIIDNKEKASDDGEPIGTAGIPILTIMRKYDVNHVLCIVIRYFGGIKLGSGGLIRAYSKSCLQALKMTPIIDLKKGFEIKITFDYQYSKQVDTLLEKSIILKKEFLEKTSYLFKIDMVEWQMIQKQLETMGSITIIRDCYM